MPEYYQEWHLKIGAAVGSTSLTAAPIYKNFPSQTGSTTANGSSAGAPLRNNQMLTTSNHKSAKASTAYAKGVIRPKATRTLTQPNQAGNNPVRSETTAVAPIKTARLIANICPITCPQKSNMLTAPIGVIPPGVAAVALLLVSIFNGASVANLQALRHNPGNTTVGANHPEINLLATKILKFRMLRSYEQ